jgi:hypothetical protein
MRASLEELSSVRNRLSSEGQLRVVARTKFKEAETNLEEQKKLLEQATARLTDKLWQHSVISRMRCGIVDGRCSLEHSKQKEERG